jgi:cbb3-type cytochrome oxidase maturation protein
MMMTGLLILVTVTGLTVCAIVAFGWAVKDGQFADFEAGARSIFDASEPVGRVTDEFPDGTGRSGQRERRK